MVKVSIIGATGYAGAELLRLLYNHPQVEVVHITSESYTGKAISEVYPHLRGLYDQKLISMKDLDIIAKDSDFVFIGLPHGHAMEVGKALADTNVRIIDLGADYRLHSADTYSAWYRTEHHSSELLAEAVYGLVEIHRDEIRGRRLVANPGCYTTCSILTLYPLVRDGLIDPDTIVIDAKSGTSGAGRSEKLGSLFCEVNENFKAYGVATHRHTPEIEQELSAAAGRDIVLQFTPHLVPMNRGILATCYAKLRPGVSDDDVARAYSMYKDEPFIRLVDGSPETRYVKGTNTVDIGWRIDSRTGNIIAMGAIDNLGKGAAGQAVQNMNLLFGLDERTGLQIAAGSPF